MIHSLGTYLESRGGTRRMLSSHPHPHPHPDTNPDPNPDLDLNPDPDPNPDLHNPDPLTGTRDMVAGWSTMAEFRRDGTTAGAYDAYFFSPTGKRFRSRPEVASYLQLGPARSRRKRLRGGDPATAAPAEGMAEVEAEMEEEAEDGADVGDEEGGERVAPKRAPTAAVRQAETEGLTLPQRAGTVGRRLRER